MALGHSAGLAEVMAERAMVRVFAGLIVTVLLSIPTMASSTAASPLQVARHATVGFATNQSNNWSGYNIGADYPGVPKGTLFKSVSGQWTVPTATQHTAGQAEDSASWVGIGGGCVDDTCTLTDNTLIQAGTEQDVSSTGQASYSAWWEIIPEPQTSVSLPVAPGNQVSVTITQTLPGLWSIVIKNVTTGKSFSTTTPYSSGMDTAEWIEETPLQIGTSGTGLSAMPDLGSVPFYGATLNGANPNYQAVDEMQLVNSSGAVLATPSAPGSTGNDFNDCTFATSCAAP
jgi:hypothetical protein